MQSFYGLLHVKKTMLKGDFIKYMHLKISLQKLIMLYAPNILENGYLAKQNDQYLVPFIAARKTVCSKSWKLLGDLTSGNRDPG